eukprot:TRINITY_DN1206_c0_g1_i10.p1 TRINITY_DN1206_c0_g1~~TRINITY_DN1206_c0_g1_i10.p1  ORF type:complete len:339 (+),score=156.44 TRINITY_DN1206_c0_g1_i10:70-1086(+)
MKLILALASVLVIGRVSGRPQDFPSEDEVELIPPVSTNTDYDDGEGGKDPVVLVVRLPGFGGGDDDADNVGGGGGLGSLFPGGLGGGFPGFGNRDSPFGGFPFLDQSPRVPQIPQDPFGLFDDIFSGGNPRDDPVEEGDVEFVEPVDTTPQRPAGCGLLCTMFGIFRGLQDEIDVINREIHNGGGSDGGANNGGGLFPSLGGGEGFNPDFDVNNSTYEEKVLEDGTTVGINKTVYADKDEYGNTFYVQTTFTQTINNGEAAAEGQGEVLPALPPAAEADAEVEAEAEAEEEMEIDNEEPEEEENDEDDKTAVIPAEDILPTEDPQFNEIDGVDEGLME